MNTGQEWLRTKDVMLRYGWKSPDTARKYMRQMAHRENPLMVHIRTLEAWDMRETKLPEAEVQQILRARRGRSILPMDDTGRFKRKRAE